MSEQHYDANPFLKSNLEFNPSLHLYARNSSRSTKICIACVACLVVLALAFNSVFFALFFVIGSKGYEGVFGTNANCLRFRTSNTPSSYRISSGCSFAQNSTAARFAVPEDSWRLVAFPSRDAQWMARGGGNISAFLITQPAVRVQSAPFVIVTHGLNGCKYSAVELTVAGVLWHSGFNVLSVDLRNHGSSQRDEHNSYASFGSHEHKDILGGLDFLSKEFPHVAAQEAKVGLYGCSMGGATMLISLSMDPKFKAAFIDSMACEVYRVVEHNMNLQVTGFGDLLMAMTCSVGSFKSNGCPPFALDPLQQAGQLNAEKNVHFFHAENDIICPMWSMQACVRAATATGASVESYYNVSSPPPYRRNACDGHCEMMLTNVDEFSLRISTFFRKVLQ